MEKSTEDGDAKTEASVHLREPVWTGEGWGGAGEGGSAKGGRQRTRKLD